MARSVLYREPLREHGFEALRAEGAIPAELCGTLYRNGPALFGSFGRPYYHLFEGDGGVSAVRFADGRVAGAHRVIQSTGLGLERSAGRPLFGSPVPRPRRIANLLRRQSKNIANTSVLFWQGGLYALLEAAPPTRISPEDLQSLGESDLDGVVAETFCAHPHFVAARRAVYGFGMRFARRSSVDLYELPLHARARKLGSLPLEAPTILHDFIATERHLIFFLAPTRLLALRAMLGEIRPERLFDWRPQQGSEIVIVPIDEPDRTRRIRTEAFLVWHFVNAFECGKEIVVDFVRHADTTALGTMRELATRGGSAIDMNLGEAWRARLDPTRGHAQLERVSDLRCEFPSIDPRGAGGPRRYAWLTVTPDRHGGIARLDLESGQVATWIPGPGQHVSEPVVAPRPGGTDERDGWVLVLVCDENTQTSYLAVLDAAAPDAGPIGRAWFDHAIPVTLHGTWVPAPGNLPMPVDSGPSRSSSGWT